GAELTELRDGLDKGGTLFRTLEVLYGDRDARKREDALRLLALVDLQRYAQEIALALQDPDSSVRIAAVDVLGQHEDPTVREAIGALKQDPVPEVRQAVRRARLRLVPLVRGA
ncbi:MAG: HEAT repeat domain-containing protein, partial [Gemmatimonadota bacterium]